MQSSGTHTFTHVKCQVSSVCDESVKYNRVYVCLWCAHAGDWWMVNGVENENAFTENWIMLFVLVVWICEIWHCCCGHIGHNCWHSWFICKLWPILENQEWSTSWWNEKFHRKLFRTIQIDSTVSITNLQRWTIERYFVLFCVNSEIYNVLFARTIWLALNKKIKFERIWCDVSIDTMWTNVKKKNEKQKQSHASNVCRSQRHADFVFLFLSFIFRTRVDARCTCSLVRPLVYSLSHSKSTNWKSESTFWSMFRRVVSVCLSTEFQ